jgi:nucleoside-diphosphate-sugar epimerase
MPALIAIMKMLVTGGQGRLGRTVTQQLIDRGDNPVSVDIQPGAGIRIVDVTDAGQLLGVAAGCDAVIHCAAIPSPERHPPEVIFTTNVIGTFAVLHAAALAGISRVVIASSLSALGGAWATPPHPPRYMPVDEDHPLEPEDPYGLSKVINERTAEMFHRRYDMTIAALRFGWILSKQEARAEAGQFAADPLRNQAGLWSYIDERDAAAACLNAIDAPDFGFSILNIIGSDTLATIPTDEALDRYAPDVERRAAFPSFQSPFSTERARQVIGFQPRHSWRTHDDDR